MTHTRRAVRLAVVFGGLPVLGCAGAPLRSDPAPVRVATERANSTLDSAYRRGDAAAVAALMTEDVVISPEGIPDLRGRETVRGLLGQFFAGNAVAAFTLVPAELEVFGDVVYERGTFTWAAGPKGQPIPAPRPMRYSLVRHRGPDGVWRIHRFIENGPAPAPR